MLALKGVSVPATQIRRGRIGGPEKAHKRRIWRITRANDLVRQHKLSQGGMVVCALRLNRVVAEAGGLRIGVGVEVRLLMAGATGPETRAADFMGLCLVGDEIRHAGYAGMIRRPPP